MIRVSLGTAIELGLVNNKSDIPPRTAYIMVGDKCNNKCSFCSQSSESNSRRDKLSRVIWPEYCKEDILKALQEYKGENIKRICIQSMASENSHRMVEEFITYIKDKIDMPISLSAKLESDEDIQKFFSAGVDKIGIAIDAVNRDLYEEIKGNSYEEKISFITKMAKNHAGKISTHIIVGLGETHREIYDLYTYLRKNNITISLFAFTPVKGTKMESINQPSIESYRKVQLMTHMLNKGYGEEYFIFKDGYIDDIKIDSKIREDVQKGLPFETRGCKNCNRPYYNERPGNTIYNYSRKLEKEEVELAINELNIVDFA